MSFFLTECIKSDNSSLGDHCHGESILQITLEFSPKLYSVYNCLLVLLTECDSCTTALLVDLEKMDDTLLWLKQQLQNIPKVPGSLSWLNPLKAKVSETMVQSVQV